MTVSKSWALGVAVILGVLFSVLESTKAKRFTPSPTGIGIEERSDHSSLPTNGNSKRSACSAEASAPARGSMR